MLTRRRLVVAALCGACLLALYFTYKQAMPEKPDQAAILTQVRRLNQLTTVRYTLQRVVGLEERAQPVGSERILLVMQATVEAGIDLAKLTPDHIRTRPDGTIAVRLPAAELLNVTVDEKETRVWDRQRTWWTPWVPYSLDLEKKARVKGLESVRQAALEMGILHQAERNADSSIRGLLGLAGILRVLVIPASSS